MSKRKAGAAGVDADFVPVAARKKSTTFEWTALCVARLRSYRASEEPPANVFDRHSAVHSSVSCRSKQYLVEQEAHLPSSKKDVTTFHQLNKDQQECVRTPSARSPGHTHSSIDSTALLYCP